MLSISPVVSILLNTVGVVGAGIWSTQVTDGSGAKVTFGALLGSLVLNGILHAVSSAVPGPLAPTPPK